MFKKTLVISCLALYSLGLMGGAAQATGTKDKELFKVPGATHIKTYYVPEYVDQIVNKLKSFYARTLK